MYWVKGLEEAHPQVLPVLDPIQTGLCHNKALPQSQTNVALESITRTPSRSIGLEISGEHSSHERSVFIHFLNLSSA